MDPYYRHVIEARQEAQASFDKTVVSLSGAALGLSLTFAKDVVGTKPPVLPGLLHLAWGSWTLSICLVLLSFYLSHQSLTCILKDLNEPPVKPASVPGGWWTRWTSFCNVAAGLLFVVGVALLAVFVSTNLPSD